MAVAIDCKTCVHEKVCDLWVQQERQDASCFCLDGCDYFEPTLTQSNEPLTLISMSDELPPDNERVLVYRSCMVDSDVGPYSVQWGWAAKRDGSHWARLPGRRPPEGEEETP